MIGFRGYGKVLWPLFHHESARAVAGGPFVRRNRWLKIVPLIVITFEMTGCALSLHIPKQRIP
jgi:hypothetical protein